ncbi:MULTISPECIES: hypothetical protein [unclassified Caballeronia]|uniref:hypothetical protein n=1 Tax=unclassified Caballeronia TaxID=2646786 RepID=UPI002855C614|nr:MULTISPECIES: hypothetical protein [unclassified Caballeronia]MDR5777402.1 hypothetical protein [Caballeronia sp. LZ002]MDR5852854.1 hypothetical protein [Caballeronia sp. LZ003]
MDIKSFRATETKHDALFDTLTERGAFFTAAGVGQMSATEMRLDNASRQLFVAFMERCESSAIWAKECASVQVTSKDVAVQKVRENLAAVVPASALFFVCRDEQTVHFVIQALSPADSGHSTCQ